MLSDSQHEVKALSMEFSKFRWWAGLVRAGPWPNPYRLKLKF